MQVSCLRIKPNKRAVAKGETPEVIGWHQLQVHPVVYSAYQNINAMRRSFFFWFGFISGRSSFELFCIGTNRKPRGATIPNADGFGIGFWVLVMIIAFITIKSSLVPLIEGLCAQI